MRLRLVCALALLVGLTAGGSAAGGLPGLPTDIELTADERARLARGEAVVRLSEPGDGERTRPGIGLRILDAAPERVFRTVADHAHYPEYVPYLISSTAVTRNGRTYLDQRLDLPMPLPDRGYLLRPYARAPGPAEAPIWEVGWRQVPGSGNVADHHGRWTLSPYPRAESAEGAEGSEGSGARRTLVVFALHGDFVPHLPGALQDRVLRRSLPWILDGLAQQVNRCRYDEPVALSCREEPASSLAEPVRSR